MKRLEGPPFDQWRDTSDQVLRHYGNWGDHTAGVFRTVWRPTGESIAIIASAGEGWEHVSVSKLRECPTWEQMVFVKRTFFKRNEWVMELHPPESKNISVHPFCLHLWRPTGIEIPIPPGWMVE